MDPDIGQTAVSDEAGAAPSPAEELRAAFWKLKASRVRVFPAHTCRASSIGEPCERRLFYTRTAGEQATPHRPELQAIFDLGNGLERYVIRELESLGADIVQREKDHLDREHQLSGRVDARIQMPTWERPLPAEVKGLNPYTAESIETVEDIRDSRQHWVRKYYDQLQVYLHFEQAEIGVFILLNKVSGEISFVDCPRDQERIDELLAKAARIRDAVAAGEPPERLETEDCGRCPFAHVCLPARPFGPGMQILDSEEIQVLIARKLELEAAKREADAIDRSLKELLPEVPELLIGDFVVTAKKVERAAYAVEASSYWQRKFSRLPTSTTNDRSH
jgi:CRISPR/Cas system-associated exonuclease Cas4 (RecB family)